MHVYKHKERTVWMLCGMCPSLRRLTYRQSKELFVHCKDITTPISRWCGNTLMFAMA